MKLHRIGNSKEPTPQQMLKMAENLKKVYMMSAMVRVSATAYTPSEIQYCIYLSDRPQAHEYFKTWPKLLSSYFRLMKAGKNV